MSAESFFAEAVRYAADGSLTVNTKGNVSFLGVDLREYLSAPRLPPDLSGWTFDGISPLGGPRSRGCDALRASLLAQGYDRIAARIPDYHVCDFWNPPNAFQRLAVPNEAFGLTATQGKELVENITQMQNAQWQTQIGTSFGARYFGEADRIPPYSFVANVRVLADLDRQFAIFPFTARSYYDPETGKKRKEPQALTANDGVHAVYETAWNTWTDENITRAWTFWAAEAIRAMKKLGFQPVVPIDPLPDDGLGPFGGISAGMKAASSWASQSNQVSPVGPR